MMCSRKDRLQSKIIVEILYPSQCENREKKYSVTTQDKQLSIKYTNSAGSWTMDYVPRNEIKTYI